MDLDRLDTPSELELDRDVRLYHPDDRETLEGPDAPRYVLYFDVVDELVFAARYRDRPSVAVLAGTRRGGAGESEEDVIEVTGFFGYQYVGGPQSWYDPVRGAIESRGASKDGGLETPVAGFFASLSGTEGKMTPELVRLHMSLFNRPGQVALVLDPDAEQLGMYARRDGERFVNVPFAVAYRSTHYAE